MVDPSMESSPSPITPSTVDTQLSTNAAHPQVLHHHIHKFPESLREPGRFVFPGSHAVVSVDGINREWIRSPGRVRVDPCWPTPHSQQAYLLHMHPPTWAWSFTTSNQTSQSKLHMEPSCSYYQGMCLPCQQLISSHLILSAGTERVIRSPKFAPWHLITHT